MSRKRRIIGAAVAAALVAVVVAGAAIVLSRGSSDHPAEPGEPNATVNTAPIAKLSAGAFGISTGVAPAAGTAEAG